MLSTNIDDMNPEWLPAVMDRLLAAGARDAWLTPILMKKGRPAHTLAVLADPAAVPALREIIYTHTTSLGVREARVDRHRLLRRIVSVDTPWGPVRMKIATLPDGEERAFPEHDDCRRISQTMGRAAEDPLRRRRRGVARRRRMTGGGASSCSRYRGREAAPTGRSHRPLPQAAPTGRSQIRSRGYLCFSERSE